jgi:CRP-like cAMP-binding protein
MESIHNDDTILVPKGTILLPAGTICSTAYRVISGCLKSYVVDGSGKEHILQFVPEGWIISDLDSFTNRKPSTSCIEAIENSKVSLVKAFDSDKLSDLHKEEIINMNKQFRNSLIASNKRLIGLLSSTAQQRYAEFTNTYPTLVQRLPLKLVASYIGVTPEYLSEIRRKKLSKNRSTHIS